MISPKEELGKILFEISMKNLLAKFPEEWPADTWNELGELDKEVFRLTAVEFLKQNEGTVITKTV
jgi:hypothetical protein